MRNLIAFAAALAALLPACSVRRPPAFRGSYVVARIEDADVLLAPTVPATHPPREPIAISLGDAAPETARKRAGCSVRSEGFRFDALGKAYRWNIFLPAMADFPVLSEQEKMHAALDGFLNQLDAVESRGCLARGGSVAAVSLIEESLPVRPTEALFYTYRYRPGEGMLDLKPGMRLRVERAYFRPGTTRAERNLKNYLGTRAVNWAVARNARGGTTFRRLNLEQTGAPPHPEASEPDQRIEKSVRHLSYYRLFLLSHYPLNNVDRVAMIVGTPTRERMTELSRAIREQPDIGCTGPLAAKGIDCVLFEGAVTVSPQIEIVKNGVPAYIAAGTQVRGALGLATPAQMQAALQKLRIERRFQETLYPVEFNRKDPAVLSLVLSGGDRVWYEEERRP